jgi:hypothetical protein
MSIAVYTGNAITSIVASSKFFAETPARFVLDKRIRRAAVAQWGTGTPGGSFEIRTGANQLDLDFGGAVTVDVPVGAYATADALRSIVESTLKAVDSGFSVLFSSSIGLWEIRHPSGFAILGATGANAGANILPTLGFADVDTTTSTAHVATEPRFANHTYLVLRRDDMSSDAAPDLMALVLQGADAGDGSPGNPAIFGATSFSDVVIYGNATQYAPTREAWLADPTTHVYTVTNRSSGGINHLQVSRMDAATVNGTPTTGLTCPRYLFVSWRHEDASPHHGVGFLRGLQRYASATGRHVRALSGHRLVDPTRPLGPEGQYPQRLLPYWILPVAVDQWLLSEWRSFWHDGVLRVAGKGAPLVVILRDDEWRDGTVDIGDEARAGQALLAAWQDYDDGETHRGAMDLYVDAAVRFAQLR